MIFLHFEGLKRPRKAQKDSKKAKEAYSVCGKKSLFFSLEKKSQEKITGFFPREKITGENQVVFSHGKKSTVFFPPDFDRIFSK